MGQSEPDWENIGECMPDLKLGRSPEGDLGHSNMSQRLQYCQMVCITHHQEPTSQPSLIHTNHQEPTSQTAKGHCFPDIMQFLEVSSIVDERREENSAPIQLTP